MPCGTRANLKADSGTFKDLKEIALDARVESSRAIYFQNQEEKQFGTAKKMRPDPNSSLYKLLDQLSQRVHQDYWQQKPVSPEPPTFEKLVMKPASFVLPDTQLVKFAFEFTETGILVRKETESVAMDLRFGKAKIVEQAGLHGAPNVLFWPARFTRSPVQTVSVANPSSIQMQEPRVLLNQMEQVKKELDLMFSFKTLSKDYWMEPFPGVWVSL